jgi:hypothetical protein
MRDDCCYQCPKHELGCRTGCDKWAEHEADKEIRYAEALKRKSMGELMHHSVLRATKGRTVIKYSR